MNKHDLAKARRSLLEHWLHILQDADRIQRAECDAMIGAAGGEPVTPPPLRLTKPSNDMMNLLLGGLEAALRGDPDPFGIEPPAKGTRPLKSRQQMILIVGELLDAIEAAKAAGVRNPETAAVTEAAARHGMSTSKLVKALDDKDLRGWAEFRLNPLWARTIKKMRIR